MRIFTKRFFTLTHRDQAAIVDSRLSDLERACSFSDPDWRRRARRMLNRLSAKAVKYGVCTERRKAG